MVSNPITANFDLTRVPYLKDRSQEQINTAAEIQSPSQAEMVKVVTGFIDNLINLEVKNLEKTGDGDSNTEAQNTAQEKLQKYKDEKATTVDPLVQGVAGELAKNIYAVKQFLIDDRLAAQEEANELKFKAKANGSGGNIAAESAKELASQALAFVGERLSSYGIKIDTSLAAQLQTEIIQELKAPPKPKSELPSEAVPELARSAATEAALPIEKDTGVAAKIEEFVENMAKSVTEIKQEIGPGTKLFKELITGITDLINTPPSSTAQASAEAGIPESAKINKLLEEFKEALKEAKSNSIPAERVKARAEAKENFFENLKVSYKASEISKEGLEVLVKALKSDDPQAAINNSQKESASKFLKDLNISADDLKQWGSMAAMVAVGLMIFCPRAITGVVQAGTGLAGMTLGNTASRILPVLIMKHFGGNNNEAPKAA